MAPFEDLNHLLLIRLLRRRSVPPRLKSNVTEPVRVLLPPKVTRCASTADYDNGRLMAATPKELLPAFHFSSNPPPSNPPRIWQARPNKLFRVCGRNLATFSDT